MKINRMMLGYVHVGVIAHDANGVQLHSTLNQSRYRRIFYKNGVRNRIQFCGLNQRLISNALCTNSISRTRKLTVVSGVSELVDSHTKNSNQKLSSTEEPQNTSTKAQEKVQSVDFTTLTALLDELNDKAIPSKLENVFQSSANKISFGLRTVEAKEWLSLSWHPQHSYLCLSSIAPAAKKDKEDQNYTLSALLRSLLQGLALTEAHVAAPYERVARLNFAERPGDAPKYSLFLELFGGGRSNLVVTDSEGIIRACGRQVSGKKAIRALQLGANYEVLSAATTLEPHLYSELITWRTRLLDVGRGSTLARSLVRCYSGVSPALASALLSAASIQSEAIVDEIPDDSWAQLHKAWIHWVNQTKSAHTPRLGRNSVDDILWQPVFRQEHRFSNDGYKYAVSDFGGLLDTEQGTQFDSISSMIRIYYSKFELSDRFDQLSRSILSRIHNALKKSRSRKSKFDLRLKEAEGSEVMRETGDKILSFAHTWQPGDRHVVYCHEDGVTEDSIEIPEDCTNAVDYAMSLHRMSQKLRRSTEKVLPLLHEVDQEIEYLEQVEWEVGSLTPTSFDQLTALTEIEEEVSEKLLQWSTSRMSASKFSKASTKSKNGTKKSKKPAATSKSNARKEIDMDQFVRIDIPVADNESISSASQKYVLVGRNSRQNDLLSFRVAKDSDLWFHVAGSPGAHVLMRMSPGDSAEDEELTFAASVAAYFSRSKTSTQVPVTYTSPQYLKRLGAPGMVSFERESVVYGRPGDVETIVQEQLNSRDARHL